MYLYLRKNNIMDINVTKEWNWQNDLRDKFIYESPDNGHTVTRRPFLADVDEKMIISVGGKAVEPEPFYSWHKNKLNQKK